MNPLAPLAFPAKTAATLGLSVGYYSAFELAAARRPASDRQATLTSWWARYGRAMLRLWGAEVVGVGPHLEHGDMVPGRDASGKGRIFVMNHRSALDIFVCFGFVDGTFVSRADVAKWPVLGPLSKRLGTLYVDRGSVVSGAAVVGAMVRAAESGRGVVVFPEGTTHVGDEVHSFRPGAFHAAKRAKAEIVPLGIAYEDDSLCFGDEGVAAHMARVSGKRRFRVGLASGEPMAPSNDVKAMEAEAYDRVTALVAKARAALR